MIVKNANGPAVETSLRAPTTPQSGNASATRGTDSAPAARAGGGSGGNAPAAPGGFAAVMSQAASQAATNDPSGAASKPRAGTAHAPAPDKSPANTVAAPSVKAGSDRAARTAPAVKAVAAAQWPPATPATATPGAAAPARSAQSSNATKPSPKPTPASTAPAGKNKAQGDDATATQTPLAPGAPAGDSGAAATVAGAIFAGNATNQATAARAGPDRSSTADTMTSDHATVGSTVGGRAATSSTAAESTAGDTGDSAVPSTLVPLAGSDATAPAVAAPPRSAALPATAPASGQSGGAEVAVRAKDIEALAAALPPGSNGVPGAAPDTAAKRAAQDTAVATSSSDAATASLGGFAQVLGSVASTARAVSGGFGNSADALTQAQSPADTKASNTADAAMGPALALLSASGGAAGPGIATAPTLVHVATAVGDPGFGQDLSRQIVALVKTGAQSAELTLNPEHLGPVSVSIQMNGLEASVSISASHEATRTALRDALPQLSALFEQGGLQLGGAHVGDGSERNAGRQAQPGDRSNTPFMPADNGAHATIAAAPAAATPGAGSTRLIDTFA